MAIPYLSNIDLQQNEIQNAVVHNQATAPSNPIEGQIYFNTASNKLFVYDGSAWLDTTGDIRNVTASAGLTGGGSDGDVSISIGQGDGITVNADDIAVNAEATQFSFVSGVLTITDGAIGPDELAATAVTAGSYGSATAIPTFTVDADGRLTAAGEASIQTSFDITDGTTTETVNGGDTITFAGTANEIEVSVSATDTVTIGLPSDVTVSNDLFVLGNLQVTGTTTTNNVETVSTSNGVIFEGNVADANELTLLAGTLTADRTVTLPDASGTVALTSDISDTPGRVTKKITGDASTTSFTVTHSFGTPIVSVQVLDYGDNGTGATYEVVYTDVQRSSDNAVTIAFGTAPSATQDYLVLVSKFPAIS